jgi:hypothetical protein
VCKRSRRRTSRRSLQTCELRAQLAGRHRSALWQGPCPGQRSPPQREFIEFLKLLDAAYLARIVIKLILDNHSAHISKRNKGLDRRATRRPLLHNCARLLAQSDPGLLSKLTRSVLRHIRVASKHELKERIMAAINDINQHPVIHSWSYKLDKALLI